MVGRKAFSRCTMSVDWLEGRLKGPRNAQCKTMKKIKFWIVTCVWEGKRLPCGRVRSQFDQTMHMVIDICQVPFLSLCTGKRRMDTQHA